MVAAVGGLHGIVLLDVDPVVTVTRRVLGVVLLLLLLVLLMEVPLHDFVAWG